jgi:hypothetical protein
MDENNAKQEATSASKASSSKRRKSSNDSASRKGSASRSTKKSPEKPESYYGDYADSWMDGSVETTIYARKAVWGDVVFTVIQRRVYYANGYRCLAKSFRAPDMKNVVRGAYRAQVWIKKRQRYASWGRRFAALL